MRVHYSIAWFLSHFGFWFVCKGYCWSNKVMFRAHRGVFIEGRYRAYGEYPDNVRSSNRFKLSGFKYHRDWRLKVER